MSRKLIISSRKLKDVSDPSLAKPHKEGAVVSFMLTSVDQRWGRYLYRQYHRSNVILNDGLKYFRKSMKLLDQCRRLPVDPKTGFRIVPDDLRNKLEINSMKFLILTKLGLEYLYAEYQLGVKRIKAHRGESYNAPHDTDDLSKRLIILKEAVGVKPDLPQQLITILDHRDIVEHPTIDRISNGNATGWKTVNLSWVLSGDIEGIIKEVVSFTNELSEKLEKYDKDNPIPGTLTGLVRGLKAGEQSKNPPSD